MPTSEMRLKLQEECRKRGLMAEETATDLQLTERISAYDQAMRPPDIPPPGDARREHFARTADNLASRADSAPDVYRIDPKSLAPDREILHRSIDQRMLDVTNRQPGFMYCWAYYGQNGQQVWAKRSLGWRVVTGPDPECSEYKEADGTRRIGDCLLMKTPIENFKLLEKRQADARAKQQNSVGTRLHELGEKARRYGLKVHDDLSTVKVGPNTLMDVVERRSSAQHVAMGKIDNMLRQGSVPGMPAPSSA